VRARDELQTTQLYRDKIHIIDTYIPSYNDGHVGEHKNIFTSTYLHIIKKKKIGLAVTAGLRNRIK